MFYENDVIFYTLFCNLLPLLQVISLLWILVHTYAAFWVATWYCIVVLHSAISSTVGGLNIKLYRISIDTIMSYSEQTKSQWLTRINTCLVYKFAGVQLTWARLCLCSQLRVGWAALFILTCSRVGTGWLLAPLGWPQLGQQGTSALFRVSCPPGS